MDFSKYKYLRRIDNPKDLKKFKTSELQLICDDVRSFLVETITQTGGHFGAGLGVVELTVALHYVFDTPTDKIVFDTGHQGYPHKILTGRKELLHTIRQHGGLSGFLKISESEFDAFGAGHASTSISAALGIAAARDLTGDNYKVIAVIGDGALTGGMAYEAMNNCGIQNRNMIVILNDNSMSIDRNVSAMSNYFNELFASGTLQEIRNSLQEPTRKKRVIGDRLKKMAINLEGTNESLMTPGMLFEAMGFKYFGPINGHNTVQLVRMLKLIEAIRGPVLLHVVTKKGKGYEPAEQDAQKLHAIGKIDIESGKSLENKDDTELVPKYQDIFGKAMVEICRNNSKVVGITAAMSEGTGLDYLRNEIPERFFDVGIAEEHAVTFAAGMASRGIIPVVAIYSSFLQRSYDQIIHDCSLQNLHVVFAIDRAGLVGQDGPTHHGVLDLVYLRSIPNMVIMAPKDAQELRDMLYSAVNFYKNSPVAIRYPRGKAIGEAKREIKQLELGKSETLIIGKDIAVLAIGNMTETAIKAAKLLKKQNISCEVVNCRFVKPLDTNMIDRVCINFSKIITIEDGQINGGFGSAVLQYINQKKYRNIKLLIHGIPDKFIEHGTREELFKKLFLDEKGVFNTIKDFIGKRITN
jgi:1-deoxy-D-xylulose-5-phosphate synthase